MNKSISQFLIPAIEHSIVITVFVFIMMVLIDYLYVLSKGKLRGLIKGGKLRQYFLASILAVVPGCLGSFLNVTMYLRGFISFGALAGGMLAASGDTAFVMLSLFPGKAITLFLLLFVTGFIMSFVYDRLAPVFNIKPCTECRLEEIHGSECRLLNFGEVLNNLKSISFERFLVLFIITVSLYAVLREMFSGGGVTWENITFIILSLGAVLIFITVPEHYLIGHVWEHILKKHLWKVFLWTAGTLVLLETGLYFFDLESFVRGHMLSVLLLAGLVGIIPDSSPQLLFVIMYSRGLIPFSVLFASSIVQDGHGMLPLLSYNVRDAVKIKLFNLATGLLAGFVLYSLGF